MFDHLIAHRGEPARWPENSLNAFRAVMQAGARFVETDVQISSDRVPVLSHDDSLLKLTGQDLRVADTALADIRALNAGQTDVFGDRFDTDRVATLAELAGLLAQFPDVRAFIELKAAAIEAFGVETAVDLTLEACAAGRDQCIPISFDDRALRRVRGKTDLAIGWVLPAWDDQTRRVADVLAPAYLFVNRKLIPGTDTVLWPGPWQWVVYTANTSADIKRLLDRGSDLVETDDIRQMARELAGRS
jgi:glycerophosphoryl diester phosphodiesterase